MKKALYALLICSTLAVALPSLSVTSFAEPAISTEADETGSDITARKAITEWRYKVIRAPTRIPHSLYRLDTESISTVFCSIPSRCIALI